MPRVARDAARPPRSGEDRCAGASRGWRCTPISPSPSRNHVVLSERSQHVLRVECVVAHAKSARLIEKTRRAGRGSRRRPGSPADPRTRRHRRCSTMIDRFAWREQDGASAVASFAPPVPPESSATFNGAQRNRSSSDGRTSSWPVPGCALEHIEAVHDHDGNTPRLAHEQLRRSRQLVGNRHNRCLQRHAEIIGASPVVDQRRDARDAERDVDETHAPRAPEGVAHHDADVGAGERLMRSCSSVRWRRSRSAAGDLVLTRDVGFVDARVRADETPGASRR